MSRDRVLVFAVALACVAGSAAIVVYLGWRPERDSPRRERSAATGPQPVRTASIRVLIRPAVVVRGQAATITVTGIRGPSLDALVVGATTNLGHRLSWEHLRRRSQGWQGLLPAPEFRGVYRIILRVTPAAPVLRSRQWLLRVFALGTLTRPTFLRPEDVARAWVDQLPEHATLLATKRWRLPTFDHRDPGLHQLLVIAYSTRANPGDDRLGIFITAVRDTNNGRWRLLEATAAP